MNKDKIKQIKAEIDAKYQALTEECKSLFNKASQELFDENPELESFALTCYTDYFCDGEPTEYHAHTDYPEINGENGYEIDDKEHPLNKLQKKVAKFLNQFDNDDYKRMFGDHVKVTVTRNKVETEEYTDHD